MTNGNDGAFADGAQTGITKREYFAAMAMQGILANQSENYGYADPDDTANWVFIAHDAVKQADILIKTLNIGEGE